jgi:hypothetical protein
MVDETLRADYLGRPMNPRRGALSASAAKSGADK